MSRSASTISKPWGIEEIWASTHHSVGKILTIKPSHRLSRKYHKIKNHNIRILEGSLTVEVGPFKAGGAVQEIRLGVGMIYHLPSNTIHRFCAGPEGAILVELSNNGPSDSVRLEDDYRRVTDVPELPPQSEK